MKTASELRNGDTIYVSTQYVPKRHASRLTPGKVYQAEVVNTPDENGCIAPAFSLFADSGEDMPYCLLGHPGGCSVLDGNQWTLEEVPGDQTL